VLSEKETVRAAIVLSVAVFLIAACRLYVFAAFSAASAVSVSLAYSAIAFAIWRIQFVVTRPNGGMIFYVGIFMGVLHSVRAEDVARGMLAGLFSGLIVALVLALLLGRKPRVRA
jgi:hypothetical protein